MSNQIILTLDKQYGNLRAYPNCPNSRNFARLTNTNTLTLENLKTIKSMGYEIYFDYFGNKLELDIDQTSII